MEISKELLSEVLNIRDRFKCDLVDIKIDANIIFIKLNRKSKPTKRINIYELAHKCKEWAYKNKYILITTYYGERKTKVDLSHRNLLPKTRIDNWESSETEPESIFKACQWILDNKN